MSLVLGIDTSTDVRVGLAGDGVPLASAAVRDVRQHAERLAPLIAELVQSAGVTLGEVTQICVGMGPGPFTGLRVGIVTAQTLASVLRVPLRGVCGLDVVAAQFVAEVSNRSGQGGPSEFVVAADARRKELYWARYSARGERIAGPSVGPPDQLPDLLVIGPGADVYPSVRRGRERVGPGELDAGLLAAVGPQLPDVGPKPLYLRRPDAAVPTVRKSTLVRPTRTR